MFTKAKGVFASRPRHAKVSLLPGGHAQRRLAAGPIDAYFMGSPAPSYSFASAPLGASSHGREQ